MHAQHAVAARVGARQRGFARQRVHDRNRRDLEQLPQLVADACDDHTVAGDDCYLMKVRAESIGALNTLVQQLSAAPLSLSTRTTIVLGTIKESPRLPLPRPAPELATVDA